MGKSILLDNGFLRDPENDDAIYCYTDYQPLLLHQLVAIPVAILLGEPGIGKSAVLKGESQRLKTENEAYIYKELNQYQSDSRLISDIFESEKMQEWQRGNRHLTLLLDSLDECNLAIRNVVRILVNQLGYLPTDRLSLRLTCRTADWPTHFTDELCGLWSSESKESDRVSVFELAPLREKDVRCATIDRRLDEESFLEEIQRKDIQPLASHPNTLNMLLSLFGKPEGLPKQRSELYRLGCETLAGERSTSRRELRHTEKLNARERMVVAARIAAQMIFSHHSTIWRGDTWEAESGDLIESSLVGDTDHVDGRDFDIDSQAFRETIECALFSGRGENRIGFAHQSYGEFLAAWFLHSHKIESQRTLPLLRHPDDKRIPSQYTETAIWLASLDGNVFADLVKSEPLLLLHADLSDTTDEQKSLLTASFLNALASKTAFAQDGELRQNYSKLSHPTLIDQLRTYILNQQAEYAVRKVALDIAGINEVSGLTGELVSLALNKDEANGLRAYACHVAAQLANESQLASLRPIALGEAGDDREDILKSGVIPYLWPSHISTAEIFALVQQKRSVRCFGSLRYRSKDFVGRFSADDLIIALLWIADWVNDGHSEYAVDRIKDAVMVEAWAKLDDARVLHSFARTVWACADRHERIFNRYGERETDWLEQDDEKRRMVITALLQVYSEGSNERNVHSLMHGETRIIFPNDAYWLLEVYRMTESLNSRISLAICIDWLLQLNIASALLDAIVSAADADAAAHCKSPLTEIINRFMEPILLESEYASELREQHAQELKRQLKKPVPLEPHPAIRVTEALEAFDKGKRDTWWQLWQELSLPDGAVRYQWNFDIITTLPGWQRATPPERSRILHCAEAWLENERLASEEIFLADGSLSYRHTATYLALQLVYDQNPETPKAATSVTWSRWAVWLIAYPFDNENKQREDLIKLAYEKASEEVLKTYRQLIDRDLAASKQLHRVGELSAIWDSQVAALLYQFLVKPELTPEQISTLMKVLLEYDDKNTFKFACNLLKETENPPLSMVAAKALVTHRARHSWQIIWEMIQKDISFGEDLFLDLAYNSHDFEKILGGLSESETARLHFWLEEHFPTTKDNQYPDNEVYSPTARDQVGSLRNYCPKHLSSLGTQASIDALRLIYERFPARDELKVMLSDAMNLYRKTTLRPISPPELITYTRREDAQLVRNSAELMKAVMTSLKRLHGRLGGQTPLAPFLWDISENGKFGRPKKEDRITDFVKTFLEFDLPTFVIDREVQIRNLKEHGIGERTDLKIETKDKDGRSIVVIIESKGCWNTELMTAMENQLLDRYLTLVPEACGIYLVGWFHCERWERGTSRTKEALQDELNTRIKSRSVEEKLSCFVLDATY